MPEDYSNEDYPVQNNQTDSHLTGISGSFIKLKSSQKIAVALLAFFALLVFFAWAVQLKNSIYSPLQRLASDSNQAKDQSVCTGDDCPGNGADEELKAKDTDSDGLNDYEELRIYKTSPYLADSDSDGFSDYEELKSDNNPNCPTGADCSQSASAPADNAGGLTGLVLDASSTVSVEGDAVLENIFLGQSDAATLRALLLQAGMDENLLGQINDKDLMRYYQDTLDSMNSALEETETDAE